MIQEIVYDVIVLGGGISGLATAYWLHKQGIQVLVLEKAGEPGGSMESVAGDGYLFDRGPNSGLETSPLIRQLVTDLKLEEEFIYASPKGKRRYILKNNKLHPLPMSLSAFVSTELFSAAGKLRIFKEPFIGKSKDGYYQSVADFVSRRLGVEFLDYMINPFVSGVYAGTPELLSVKSAFPKLYALEENYGSLTAGFIRGMNERRKRAEVSKQSAQMFSFKKGMQTLPKALAAKLGVRANFLTDVESVRFDGAEYAVKYNRAGDFRGEVKAKAVISTIPAYLASKVFSELIPDAAAHFDAIIHPPVNVLYLGYEAKDVKRELDGFGFLIPEKENKSFLGAIWSSTLFPQRAPLDVVTFTLFIGGMRNAGFLQNGNDDLSKKVLTEFNEIMHISASPVFQAHRFWQKAIPQYTLGYIEHERYFDSIEAKFPGLFISGNFRGGISVGDCVKNSGLVSEKVLNYLNKKGT